MVLFGSILVRLFFARPYPLAVAIVPAGNACSAVAFPPTTNQGHLSLATNLRQFEDRPDCSFVYGAYSIIDEAGNMLHRIPIRRAGEDLFAAFLSGNLIGMQERWLGEAERLAADVERVLGKPRGIRIGEAPRVDPSYGTRPARAVQMLPWMATALRNTKGVSVLFWLTP